MTTPPGSRPEQPHSHYFDSTPSAVSDPGVVHVSLPDFSFDLATDSGVFGRRRLDPGTKILLLEAPELPEQGEFLDLGCGVGPIAITMALRRPSARVWAVDINERARHLTSANSAKLGTGNVVVLDPTDVPEEIRFDVIWSNPPIKIGKKALHAMLTTWIPRLTERGRAVLVVHKNLGSDSLAAWLQSNGWAVERLTSRQGYRLLEVRRSP
ncbi:MAG: class I SAM-dependent methyltransferase [Actinomycetota bacterium]